MAGWKQFLQEWLEQEDCAAGDTEFPCVVLKKVMELMNNLKMEMSVGTLVKHCAEVTS